MSFVHCPYQKQKLVSMLPHRSLHHPTVRQSEHTQFSTFQQQRTSKKYLMGNDVGTTPQTSEKKRFWSHFCCVLECISNSSCKSYFLGKQVFPCQSGNSLTVSNTWAGSCTMRVHIDFNFSTCALSQIKYVLPKRCPLSQYLYGSQDPPLGYSSLPHTRA